MPANVFAQPVRSVKRRSGNAAQAIFNLNEKAVNIYRHDAVFGGLALPPRDMVAPRCVVQLHL